MIIYIFFYFHTVVSLPWLFRSISTHVHAQTIRTSRFKPSGCHPHQRRAAAHFSSVTADDTINSFIRPLCRLLSFLPQSTTPTAGCCMCSGAEHTPADVKQLSHLSAPPESFVPPKNMPQYLPHQRILISAQDICMGRFFFHRTHTFYHHQNHYLSTKQTGADRFIYLFICFSCDVSF